MPPPAQEVKYHPSSVNHLIVQQLITQTKAKTFLNFLSTELACVTKCVMPWDGYKHTALQPLAPSRDPPANHHHPNTYPHPPRTAAGPSPRASSKS